MLQLFHKYFRSFFLLLVSGLVVFSMLFFGTGSGLDGRPSYALKINGEEISVTDYYNYQRNYEDQLRSSFGPNYGQIFPPDVIRQQVNDAIINSTLFRQFSSRLGLAVGDKELSSDILEKTFMGNLEAYQSMLRARGITAAVFEGMREKDLLSAKTGSLLQLAARASSVEADASYIQSESEYSLDVLSFDKKDFLPSVTEPKDSEIEAYYNEHASEFENPEQAKYNYVLLEPSKSLNLVDVSDEDLQLYYADNIADFTKPAQARIRQIKIDYSDTMDPLKQSEQKVLADDIFEKAKAGEDFAKLVKAHSTDSKTKDNGGDIGWVKPAQLDSSMDTPIFAAAQPEVLKPIVAPDGLYILKIEEFQPEAATPLDQVKDVIIPKIQERDAPAFILAKATKMLQDWKANTKMSLKDLAEKNQLTFTSQDALLSAAKDPTPQLKGLSRKIIEQITENKQLVEIGDLIILAEITERKPAGIPAIPEIKSRIVETLKEAAAKKAAQEKAEKTLADLKSDASKKKKQSDLADALNTVAKELKLTVTNLKEVKRSNPKEDLLTNPNISKTLFAQKNPGLIQQVMEHKGAHHIILVKEIKKPESAAEKSADFKDAAERENLRVLGESFVNTLKLESKIEIDPAYGSLS